MGIRYYAYAFDSDQAAQALADPRTVIGPDPLADAFGLERGVIQGYTDLRQSLPERDLLYLDKAWPYLQRLTGPPSPGAAARASYRMFEGHVTHAGDGLTWHPWVRALPPHEVALIARDLEAIDGHAINVALGGSCSPGHTLESEAAYVNAFLDRAKVFASTAASDGRGCAYLIG